MYEFDMVASFDLRSALHAFSLEMNVKTLHNLFKVIFFINPMSVHPYVRRPFITERRTITVYYN